MNKKITKFSGGGIKNTTRPGHITLEDALNEIETEVYKSDIDRLRAMDAATYRVEKSNLDYYVFSCECSKRDSKNVDKINGIICGDIDGLESLYHAEQIKDDIRHDKYIIAAWVSPSGKGLKFLCGYDNEQYTIADAFHHLDKYMKDQYDIDIDQSCKDITRACFASSDKEIHINDKANILPIKKDLQVSNGSTREIKISTVQASKKDFAEMEKCVSKIENESINIADSYSDWINVGFSLAFHFGENGRDFFHRISHVSNKYDGPENESKYDHLLKTTKHDIPLSYIYFRSGFKEYKGNQLKTIKAINYLMDEDLIYNELTGYIENSDGDVFLERDINSLYLELQLKNITITDQIFIKIINSRKIASYHPLKDFYNQLLDFVSGNEIEQLFNSIQFEGDKEILQKLILRWMLQIPATINGHVSELCLVLVGPQGNGKTEFFRRLLPPLLKPYFAIDKLDQGKDSDILMTQKLIILDDEFAGKSKKDANHLKATLSKDKFCVRRPYGKLTEDIPRIAIFCGTSNTQDVIYDNTGNRRIIPIKLTKRDFHLFDQINKEKLMAALFKIWESDHAAHKLSKGEQDFLGVYSTDFNVVNYESEMLDAFVSQGEIGGIGSFFMSASEISNFIFGITKVRVHPMKIGQELTQKGFEKVSNKGRKGYWVKLEKELKPYEHMMHKYMKN